MKNNPLQQLQNFGQSFWLDYIRRDLLRSGELKRMINDDGLRGMTSNPSIFEKAISETTLYDADIQKLSSEGMSPEKIYSILTQQDVSEAADEFRPLYDSSEATAGYVSLEVNPNLAHDTKGTINEARALWDAVNRPNIMIKVPATIEGLPAITQLISEGINVNVTLLFGLQRYRAVAQAYIKGMRELQKKGKSMKSVFSVASFFLSRIDVLIDPMIEKIEEEAGANKADVASLHGEVAILSAKAAYEIYSEIFGNSEFQALKNLGAKPQQLLWASTSTKDPTYSDVKYVEALIGPDTVNTLPPETIDAYRDHGKPEGRLVIDMKDAQKKLNSLQSAGIDLNAITNQLEQEGVKKFIKAYDLLINSLVEKTNTQSVKSSA